MSSAVIVGAGVAGLSAAYRLAAEGWDVTVVEIEDVVGGLAKSFYYNGYSFDVGPHRFHTDDKGVEEFILNALGDDHIIIDRSSAVWFFGRYHEWPLRRSTIFKLPPKVMFGAAIDLFRKKAPRDETFQEYVLGLYGKTLFDHFFKDYTEKFLMHGCDELHSDWANAGINRAVIDKRIKANTLTQVIKSTLFPRPVHSKFIYPRSGGVGVYSERLVRMIEKEGGQVLTGAAVTDVSANGRQVTELTITSHASGNRQRLRPDLLVWTAPAQVLGTMLGLPQWNLTFLDSVLYNFELEGRPPMPYQWIYYGSKDFTINRVSIPANFGDHTAPEGRNGVCAELCSKDGDDTWKTPEARTDMVIDDLLRAKLIRSREEVHNVHIEKVRNSYPIYTIDYRAKLHKAMEDIRRFENVLLLGRTGTFWYNNMDHSIRMALDMTEVINSGGDIDAWRGHVMENRDL
jgi:protoporphyrinogen oxidase